MTTTRLVPIVLMVAAGCAGIDTSEFLTMSRNTRTTPVTWTESQQFSFDDGTSIETAPTPQGSWHVTSGALHAVEGEKNRTILLVPNSGDAVRIAFDARLYSVSEGRIGDITVLLNATDDEQFFSSGYALTTGSFWNNCTTFYRLGNALARTEHSPLRAGRTYHVVVELIGGHIRYWLDDQILLETWDPQALILAPDKWIGIRTWNTHLVVDNLTVQRGRRVEALR